MSQHRVLLVEDDLWTRAFLTDVLAEIEVDVVAVATTVAARDTLTARPDIRLALVDRILPDGDGRALCYELKKIQPTLKIVQMSSHPAGAVDVNVIHSILDKPFTIETLESLVLTLLEDAPDAELEGPQLG
ncbi:MAG: DNA-binding response OmpR family regulator [Bradymonadia bacterium]|jgi:DNA-binding response OmpR family regulator